MSEIEKLYKNAGVELVADVKFPTKDVNYNVSYPPFTAEKQLELIKWFIHSRHFSSTRFYVAWVVDDIASHINFLWEKMTEEEKQQIKEILE